MRRLIVPALCLLSACGGNSPTQPSASQQPPPVATLYAVSGAVTVGSASGTAVPSATVRIVDGPNAGRSSTTDGNGRYSIAAIPFGSGNMEVVAAGYTSATRVLQMTSGVVNNTVNFTVLPASPFVRSGAGDTVFDIPTYVTRLRVQANFPGSCQNFIVRVGGRLLVNEILGTCSIAVGRAFDGTYTTTGGVAEVTNSTGVNWTMFEVR